MISLVAVFLLLTQIAFADLVNPQDQNCSQDSDCALISLACCPCAGDQEYNGAVNKQFAKQDEHQCTKDEIQQCAENGACAQRAKPKAVCFKEQCVVKMIPLHQ